MVARENSHWSNTIAVLDINHPDAVAVREALSDEKIEF
jgi:hypothetical protein